MLLIENPIEVLSILLIGQLGLMGILLIRKSIRITEQREIEEISKTALPVYLDYFVQATEENEKAILDRADPPEVVEAILLQYNRNLRGTGNREQVNELAKYLLTDHYAQCLTSPNWSVRMNTYMAIEQFELTHFCTKLWNKLKNKTKFDEEVMQIQKTLAALNDFTVIPYALEKWALSERDYQELTLRMDDTMLPKLLSLVSDQEDRNYLHALITRVALTHDEAYFPFLNRTLQDDLLETRLVTLKALKQTRTLVRKVELMPFLMSEHWEERMIATRICGIVQSSQYKQVLFDLMGDDVWWVRYRAGEAINQYADGDIILDYVANDHKDRYARDMAKQWIGSVS